MIMGLSYGEGSVSEIVNIRDVSTMFEINKEQWMPHSLQCGTNAIAVVCFEDPDMPCSWLRNMSVVKDKLQA